MTCEGHEGKDGLLESPNGTWFRAINGINRTLRASQQLWQVLAAFAFSLGFLVLIKFDETSPREQGVRESWL
jgi:hypothetical protein